METIVEAEYVFLRCRKCGERIKLAKHKGSDHWTSLDFLPQFLMEHGQCSPDTLDIQAE